MHLVPYDKKLLFGSKGGEECNYDPLYSGSKIRWYMREKGIPQIQLAKGLGIGQPYLSGMLMGTKNLTEEYTRKIAEILGVSLADITGCKCIEEEKVSNVVEEVDSMAAGVKVYDLVGFKNKIRNWLATRDMKTRDLSGMLGFDERDIRITRWFHGSENPTMSDLEKLSELMGCSIEELIGGEVPVEEATESKEVPVEGRLFKDVIAGYLEETGLSKLAFGKLTGIDAGTISKWFTIDTLPSELTLHKIINATGLNFDGVKIYEGRGGTVDPNKERVATPISIHIKEYMHAHNLNQKQFSELVGCNRASLYAWLNDGRIPGEVHLNKISEITGMSPEELLGDLEEPVVVENEAVIDDFSEYMAPPIEETVEEVVMEDSPLDIEILKAEIMEDLLQRSRDEIMEDLRKEFLDITPAKPENPNQRRVDELKKAAQMILDNAESIVGSENNAGDLTVSIYFRSGEVPRVNVDRDLYF